MTYGIYPGDVEVALVPPETEAERVWWAARRRQVIARLMLRNTAIGIGFFGATTIINSLIRGTAWAAILTPSRLAFIVAIGIVGAVLWTLHLSTSARKHEILVKRFYEKLEDGL